MIFLISPEKFRFSCKNDEFLSPTVSNESENFKSKNYENINDKGRKTADFPNNRRQSIAALTKREDYNRILDMEETLNSENLISSHLNRINSCLLSIFLEYLSLLMKNVRNSAQNNSNNDFSNISINQATIYNRTKIGFSILANIVEDVFACTEIFNIENKFIVNIHKVSMRHRKKFGNNPCFNEDFIPSDQECLKYQELKNPVSSNSSNLAAGDHQIHQQTERRTSSQPFKISDANCTPMAQFLNPNKPLAYWILTLCIEFILTNLSRQNFPVEIYSRVLTIVHRLLIQMKRYEIRLTMPFPNLWHALITLIKFIKNKNYCKIQVMSLNSTQSNSNSKIKQSKQDEAAKNRDLLLVLKQTIDIFNIFITFGDSFLQCPKQYDRLFYEIIRLEDVFVACEEFIKGFGGEMLEIEKIEGQLEGTMEQMKEKQVQEFVAASVETQLGNIEQTITSSNSSDNNPLNPPLTLTQPDVELQILKNLSSNVLFSLKNILDIINHFSPKIANHCKTNKIPSLTEKQVLTLVRENYTDLILCMNENLEMVDSIDIVYDKNFADADMERGLVDVARDTYGRELEEFLSD